MTQQAGSQLQRAVEVMDRLRSPGGCPWDAAQTHESLTRYLLEETYEVLEAIETGDLALLREELGDLLLQVLFHARIAAELPADSGRFDIEDVAAGLVEKLIGRHPHVFGDVQVASVEEQVELWERLKVAEKARTSATDGVPLAQPALALTAKLISRADRAGLADRAAAGLSELSDEFADRPDRPDRAAARLSDEFADRADRAAARLSDEFADRPDRADRAAAGLSDEFGSRLFAVAQDAVAAGVDPEAALRRTARAYRQAILDAEGTGDPEGTGDTGGAEAGPAD